MANNSTTEIRFDDPLSQFPWSTIIKSFVSARIVLSTVGIILNGCNFVIVNRLPETCGNHFKLIQSLATADIALCFTDVMMLATYAYYSYGADVKNTSTVFIQRSGPTSEGPLCVWAALDCFQLCVFLATLFAVSMIAFDCFLKIKIPLKYRATVTKRRLTVAIIISWLFSVAIGLVVMFGIGHMILPFQDMPQNRTHSKVQPLTYDNRTKNNCSVLPFGCNSSNVYSENGTHASVPVDDTSFCRMLAMWGLGSKFLSTGLCSLLCTALMISLYCCICCRVKKLHNRTERLTGVHTGSRKTVITTSFIVGSFLLAWGPPSWILLMFPFVFFSSDELQPADHERALISSTDVLQVLNATLDALIYAIRLEEIRQSYRIAFDKLKYKCFRSLRI